MTSQDINSHLQGIEPAKFRTPRENDPRLAETSQAISLLNLNVENSWILLGQPDDEGVSFNRGRVGASAAPNTIRKYLYSLVDHGSHIFDVGNADPENKLDLNSRHQLSYECSKQILKNNFLLSVGGGHDYAYPNIKAFLERYPKNSLVLNIDAHLDLRPCDPEPHSGTGFRRIYEEGTNYSLIEFGIQKSFASKEQIEFAEKHKVEIVYLEQAMQKIKSVIEKVQSADHLFLSIDIDGFSSSIAPGASAAWPLGLQYSDVSPLFDAIHNAKNLKALGVYEVSPALDENDKTSKLAAQLIYQGLDL